MNLKFIFFTNNIHRINKLFAIIFCVFVTVSVSSQPQTTSGTPVMGWTTKNSSISGINEAIIKGQADAMVSSGLATAGYKYINIDDGFFNGRYADGTLRIDTVKFPGGMKALVDYIHSKGLKAGFYSDAGSNTCGSINNSQTGGTGAGLYNHDQQDIDLFFKTWGFDFLKIDFCGGLQQALDEKTRYTAIKKAIDNTGRTDVNYNINRGQFPGVWVTSVANSWRVSQDIGASWSSITSIIDKNTFLSPYVSPGHYNDMDVLMAGRGLSAEEEKSQFSMWCILSSPLIITGDITKISQQTKNILTNPEVIAVNQDTTGLQGRLVSDNGAGLQVWAKCLNGKLSKERAVVLFNRTSTPASVSVKWRDLNLQGPVTVRDLWSHTDLGSMDSMYTTTVPAHGVVMLKVAGSNTRLQDVFEAENAWINNYNLMQNNEIVANQGRAEIDPNYPGRAKASWLGGNTDNFIEFRDIYTDVAGMYPLTISYVSGLNRDVTISVNGKDTLLKNMNSGGWSTLSSKTLPVTLSKGYNTIRFSNATGWIPDLDKISIYLNNKPDAAGAIAGPASVCKGYSNITYSVPVIRGAATYIWTLPSGTTGSSTTNTISVNFSNIAAAGNIRVKGFNALGEGSESTFAVDVKDSPETPVITYNNGVLQSSATSGNQWYFNNTIIANAVNPTFTPSSNGNYYVITTASNGCQSQSNIMSFATGVGQTKITEGVRVYPNPTKGILKISIDKKFDSDYKVEVYDNAGSLLLGLGKNKLETVFEINLSRYPAGVYIIHIFNTKGCYTTRITKR